MGGSAGKGIMDENQEERLLARKQKRNTDVFSLIMQKFYRIFCFCFCFVLFFNNVILEHRIPKVFIIFPRRNSDPCRNGEKMSNLELEKGTQPLRFSESVK